jgi:hypothetical protein
MIQWNQLSGYKVLLHTSGTIFRDSSIPAVSKWLSQGGVLITRGLPHWRLMNGREVTSAWFGREDASAAKTGAASVRVFRVGKGTIYAIDAPDVPSYLAEVVSLLTSVSSSRPAPLHGFKPVDDGTWMTEFASGRLMCNAKTYEMIFLPVPSKN